MQNIDLVVKIGSMALIQKEDSVIDYNVFQRLAMALRPGMILVSSGAAEIGGLLNAETVEISANRAVHISAIGGGTIRVLQKDTATVLGIFHTSPGCARIGSIEGDNIELENVEAEIVRGKYVRIGHGCRIGTVEYGENLEAEPGTVSRSTQTGAK